MKKAAIIAVGRLKTGFWREAASCYLKKLAPWRQIECIEVKDGAGKLAQAARAAVEGERLLGALKPGDLPVALDAGGAAMTSEQFAQLLRNWDEKTQARPAFLIGGPFGLSGAVLAAAKMRISLSPMTWPHELARALLLEQLYRAESILRGAPYHH